MAAAKAAVVVIVVVLLGQGSHALAAFVGDVTIAVLLAFVAAGDVDGPVLAKTNLYPLIVSLSLEGAKVS